MLKSVIAFLTRFRKSQPKPTYTPRELTDEEKAEREKQRKRMEEFRKNSPFTYK